MHWIDYHIKCNSFYRLNRIPGGRHQTNKNKPEEKARGCAWILSPSDRHSHPPTHAHHPYVTSPHLIAASTFTYTHSQEKPVNPHNLPQSPPAIFSSLTESKVEIFNVADGVDGGEKAPAQNRIQVAFERHLQPCLAELFGTTLFVFVGCASVIGNQGVDGVVQPVLAHGLALGMLVAVLGELSGGHFNPAVSLSVYMCGGMEPPLLGPYVVVQMLGGMIGTGVAKAVYPAAVFNAGFRRGLQRHSTHCPDSRGHRGGDDDDPVPDLGGVPGGRQCSDPQPDVLRSASASPSAPASSPGGPCPGSCMNPAQAFGPAVVANYWSYHWIYWVGPIHGSLSALFGCCLGTRGRVSY